MVQTFGNKDFFPLDYRDQIHVGDLILKPAALQVIVSSILQELHKENSDFAVCIAKDTESDVQRQETRERELQLVVEQRAVWENALLDAGFHRTLEKLKQSQTLPKDILQYPYRTSDVVTAALCV